MTLISESTDSLNEDHLHEYKQLERVLDGTGTEILHMTQTFGELPDPQPMQEGLKLFKMLGEKQCMFIARTTETDWFFKRQLDKAPTTAGCSSTILMWYAGQKLVIPLDYRNTAWLLSLRAMVIQSKELQCSICEQQWQDYRVGDMCRQCQAMLCQRCGPKHHKCPKCKLPLLHYNDDLDHFISNGPPTELELKIYKKVIPVAFIVV